jgi:hypothetical protein
MRHSWPKRDTVATSPGFQPKGNNFRFLSSKIDQANNVTRIAQVMKIWENKGGVHEKFPTTSTK